MRVFKLVWNMFSPFLVGRVHTYDTLCASCDKALRTCDFIIYSLYVNLKALESTCTCDPPSRIAQVSLPFVSTLVTWIETLKSYGTTKLNLNNLSCKRSKVFKCK